MFKTCEFQYDGKSSNDFNLKIVKFSDTGLRGAELIGIPLEIEEQKIKNNPKPFFYGVQIAEKLQFKIQIVVLPEDSGILNENPLTPHTAGAISKWLFKKEYKEFKIIDTDYSNIVYNCIFQNPRRIELGMGTYGFELDVTCDRPYGYRKQTITRNVSASSTFNLKNLGYTNDYIKPEIEFTTSTSTMSIRNNTDNGRDFKFTGLSNGETIYVNNEREEIVSSTGLNRNGNFNFNWFRIVPDYYNNITITGTGTVTFRIEFPMPF
jgi:hypothetical protein